MADKKTIDEICIHEKSSLKDTIKNINTSGLGIALLIDEDKKLKGIITDGSEVSDIGLAAESGAVYVFRNAANTWSQMAYIKASNTETFDSFGGSVTLSNSGDTLAVGASREAS